MTQLNNKNSLKIILSSARAGSATFQEMFRQSNAVMYHEPSVQPYCSKIYGNLTNGWWNDPKITTFLEVEKKICKTLETNDVVIKDMISSFPFNDKLYGRDVWLLDECLPRTSRIDIIFLLRKPESILVSLSKFPEAVMGGFTFGCNYKKMYDMYNFIVSTERYNKVNIYIINVDVFFGDAQKYVPILSEKLDTKLVREWQPKPDSYDGKDINEAKVPSQMWRWHGDAFKSTGIKPLADRSSEIKELLERYPSAVPVYEESLKYYKMLLDIQYKIYVEEYNASL